MRACRRSELRLHAASAGPLHRLRGNFVADGSLSIVLDQNCVTPEVIDLILATLSAASFDFVAVDVPVGVHTVSLQARITTSTSVENGTATALGFVGKGTLLAESVRLAR